MRDIHVGKDINVGGDLVINDQSQKFKLLIHCTNEELLEEEKYRQANLADERATKFNEFIVLIAVTACLIFGAGIWQWFQGKMDLYSLITGGAGFMVGLASLKLYERPTVFEQRQMAALEEIHMLLRERRVR